jgi:D-arabinose 1-dehydrogenase-like Zn-dependent alcohol dehydrogenase
MKSAVYRRRKQVEVTDVPWRWNALTARSREVTLAGVCSSDLHIYEAGFRHRRLGHGPRVRRRVGGVGPEVRRFKKAITSCRRSS